MDLRDTALACSPCALAQAADVTGTVTAPDGSAFRGAFVQAENAQTKLLVSVLTDNQGRYRITDLPAGEYRLGVRAPGYAASRISSCRMPAFALASAHHWHMPTPWPKPRPPMKWILS